MCKSKINLGWEPRNDGGTTWKGHKGIFSGTEIFFYKLVLGGYWDAYNSSEGNTLLLSNYTSIFKMCKRLYTLKILLGVY